MVNTKALKKGTPPARGNRSKDNVIEADPRPTEGKNKPLQVMVPPHIFDAFSNEAGAVFGVNKGAKSKMFIKLWELHETMKP